jgi:MFS family permease
MPRATAIAFVSGSGDIGFLFGPALIGWTAQRVGVGIALWLLIPLSVLAAALAKAVSPPNPET